MENKRKSFVVLRYFYDMACRFSDSSKLALLEAVFEYGLNDKEPDFSDKPKDVAFALETAFIAIKASISNSTEKHDKSIEDGKRGGNPNFQKGQPNPYYKRQKSEKITSDKVISKAEITQKITPSQKASNCNGLGDAEIRGVISEDNLSENENYSDSGNSHSLSNGYRYRDRSPSNELRETKDGETKPKQSETRQSDTEQSKARWRPVVE